MRRTAFRQLSQYLAIALHDSSLLSGAFEEKSFSTPDGRKAENAAFPTQPYVTARLKLAVLCTLVLELSVPLTVMVKFPVGVPPTTVVPRHPPKVNRNTNPRQRSASFHESSKERRPGGKLVLLRFQRWSSSQSGTNRIGHRMSGARSPPKGFPK